MDECLSLLSEPPLDHREENPGKCIRKERVKTDRCSVYDDHRSAYKAGRKDPLYDDFCHPSDCFVRSKDAGWNRV